MRVVSELLLRGFRPRIGVVDDGVDVELENNVTIQVKTSLRPRMQGSKPAYHFSFQAARYRPGTGGKMGRVQRMVADFAVCWCVLINQFYVVPRDAIGTRTVVYIPTEAVLPGRPSMFTRYLEDWEALR